MGCLDYTLSEWHKIGILESNDKEFPNDGSDESMRRVRAFDYAKVEALEMAKKYASK